MCSGHYLFIFKMKNSRFYQVYFKNNFFQVIREITWSTIFPVCVSKNISYTEFSMRKGS